MVLYLNMAEFNDEPSQVDVEGSSVLAAIEDEEIQAEISAAPIAASEEDISTTAPQALSEPRTVIYCAICSLPPEYWYFTLFLLLLYVQTNE